MQPIFAIALFAALVAIASSAPQGGNTPVPILSSQFDQKEDGSYSFSYETGDGIKRSEAGAQKKIGEETGSTSNGSISWKTPEGKTVTITFVADERGFQPKVTVS
ncbi:LOW QUALITY PROTEIN: endocuticle structural glycoprotein SgAbd-5 [Daphnia magna]|uniref:Endocuticle structural glycoprotein SgAbd-1 n=2 Tax=Daphnia magna TaxID=35525 RepID=A0A164PIN1_9CRUS|nr:LOW QUALITY PROTEIN: endocuticle structural glycoprotein SgAbd-5 [Daphnia magna]KAK4019067.1 hypothetical protein OUZ56_001098 [Daphnia magna]KZS06866.1 Endocuticle structural glycoprotein SgAbd-1 [Daphnia magna]